MTNRQIRLHRRPVGPPTLDCFTIQDSAVAAPRNGEVLRRTIYLSLDPYMRGWMDDRPLSYAPPIVPVGLGEVMVGGTVSEVLESNDATFSPGDVVLGRDGWQQYATSPATGLRKLDSHAAPISTALGVLGMPGFTAYIGLLEIGRVRLGETVVVSAAAGAIGSVVGQIARLKGCRAVGIVGSDEKSALLVNELGFDAAVNRRAPDFRGALARACPNGIDVYFENVGGPVLSAVLQLVNRGARIPLCGLISQYNAVEPPAGPDLGPLLANRALIQGFIIDDHLDRFPEFLADCGAWLRRGELRCREDTVEGIDAAPEAFIGLFEGRNVGKLLVRVSTDPTEAHRA
jgi:NADPH-dependent curcumin reductase CurA